MRGVKAAIVGMGAAVVPLDFSVNVAFPAIVSGLRIEVAQIQWVVIAYVLVYGGLMLAFGRMGDMIGHARVFRAGLIVSALGLAVCSLVPAFHWLLAGRVVQGIGAALVGSCAPALITMLYPENERPRALAVYGMSIAIASALGPLVAGPLVELGGWPAVFWFRIPILVLTLLLFRSQDGRGDARQGEGFDYAGALLFGLTLASGIYLLNALKRGAAGESWGAGLACALALACFIWRERQAAHPLINLRAFGSAPFAAVNLACALINFGGFFIVLIGPFYFARIGGLSSYAIGLLLAAGPAAGIGAAALAGRLIVVWSAGAVAALAALLVLIGVAAMMLWGGETPPVGLLFAVVVQGAGLAMFQVAYLEIVSAAMGRAARGVAGSLAMVTRMLGVVIAASVLTLIFDVGLDRAAAAGLDGPAAFLPAFSLTALAATASVFAGLALHLPLWSALRRR